MSTGVEKNMDMMAIGCWSGSAEGCEGDGFGWSRRPSLETELVLLLWLSRSGSGGSLRPLAALVDKNRRVGGQVGS